MDTSFLFCKWTLSIGLLVCPGYAFAQKSPFLTDSLPAWQLAGGGQTPGVADLPRARLLSGTASVTYLGGKILRVGTGWRTWSSNYAGDVIWTGSKSPVAFLGISNVDAFGFEVQPQSFQPEQISVTLSTGQHISRSIGGDGGARFFGFVGRGVHSILITDDNGGSFALGNLRLPPQPLYEGSVTAEAPDLISDSFPFLLSNTDSYGSLGLTINSNLFCYGSDGKAVSQSTDCSSGPGGSSTIQMPVDRTTISAGVVDGIGVSDDDEPPVSTTNYTLAQPWIVNGLIKHTVYNTPAESNCTGTLVQGYVVGPSCTFYSVMMKSDFQSQAALNGSGTAVTYGLVASNIGTPLPPTCARPAGSTTSNTFIEIKQPAGSCGTALSTTSVAVSPNPKKAVAGGVDAVCGDTILEVNSSNSNKAIKVVEDACGDCKHKTGSLATHIDDYLASNTQCFAVGSFSAWTADTVGENQ